MVAEWLRKSANVAAVIAVSLPFLGFIGFAVWLALFAH